MKKHTTVLSRVNLRQWWWEYQRAQGRNDGDMNRAMVMGWKKGGIEIVQEEAWRALRLWRWSCQVEGGAEEERQRKRNHQLPRLLAGNV